MEGLDVRTPAELESAVDAIFEKAVGGAGSYQLLASVCAKLEKKCSSTKDLVHVYNVGGLSYCELLTSRPQQVAGPFQTPDDAVSALKRYCEELNDFYDELPFPVCDCRKRFSSNGEIFALWRTRDNGKFYLSRPTMVGGPVASAAEAKKVGKAARPVRCVLLQRCQKELDKSNHDDDGAEAFKQRKVRTCRFLGALFRQVLVERATLYKCIDMLLNTRQDIAGGVAFVDSSDQPDEVGWEAVCALLESAGSQLEATAKDPMLSKYLWLMKMKCRVVSSNLARRVQEIIDLRAKGWDAETVEMEQMCSQIAQIVGEKRRRGS